MSNEVPTLVTGAADGVGGVGRTIVEILRQRGLPVRALVHHEDERAKRCAPPEPRLWSVTSPNRWMWCGLWWDADASTLA